MQIKENTSCRNCASGFTTILDFGKLPLAGGFLLQPKKNSSNNFKLSLVFCENCSLLQTPEVIDANYLFTNYSFSSSTIDFLKKYFIDYADWLVKNFKPKKVLEFGCNDGVLLEQLRAKKVKTVGIDAADNICDIAKSKQLDIFHGFLNVSTAKCILAKHDKFDIVSGSNCFAHNDDLAQILQAAKILLTDNGKLCLEVMYAKALLDGCQWDSIYHEHLNYFSLLSLKNILANSGFYLTDAMETSMHGGTLRIVASPTKTIASNNVARLLNEELEAGLDKLSVWQQFAKQAMAQIQKVRNLFDELSLKHTIAAYGASGRATMWLNMCKMDYLKYIVDESPFRAGKYVPGVNVPIVSQNRLATEPVDYIFIPAWNYFDIIVKKNSQHKGNWVRPLPSLEVI